MAVIFIGGGNQITRRKPPTCRKSLTNLSHNGVSSTHRLSGIRTHNVGGNMHWLHRCYKSNYHTVTTDREKQKQYHTTITVPNLDAISVAIATIYMTEHTIYHVQCEHAKYFTTDVTKPVHYCINSMLLVFILFNLWFLKICYQYIFPVSSTITMYD
jgi:hypothetical protein